MSNLNPVQAIPNIASTNADLTQGNTVKTPWKIILSFCLGTFLEFFDYSLYGFFAGTLGSLFFPVESTSIQLIASWAIFSVGFIFRPLGGFIFGFLADKYGRKNIICFTIVLMSVPTICIGLLPTYDSMGILAPILLIVCRLLQGLAISGEINATSIYVLENNLPRKGFLAALCPFSAGVGLIAAGSLSYIFTSYSSHYSYMSQLSWRAPFVISGVLVGLIGWYLRRRMQETARFVENKQKNNISENPIKETLKNDKLSFVTNIVCSTYICVAAYLLLVYLSTYLKLNYDISQSNSILILMALTVMQISILPLSGLLSDYYPRWKVLAWASLAGTVFAIMLAVQPKLDLYSFLFNIFLILIAYGFYDGPVTIYLPELFKTSNRYSATAFGYNIGGGAIGGLSPFLISVILQYIPNPQLVLGTYMAVISGLAGVFVLIHQYNNTTQKNTQLETNI